MGKILIYGAYGFVGREISRLVVSKGLKPVISGRNKQKTIALASALKLDHLVFPVEEADKYLEEFDILMNCAGPYIETYKPLVLACIKHDTHYLDLSGEIPVYKAIHKLSLEHKNESGAMLLPGIGFDVAATDCLALFLKENLPSGSKLLLAFKSEGPAGLPPGTVKTMVTLIPFGNWIRRNGELVRPENGLESRKIRFEDQPVNSVRLTWGDIYTAFYSTGVPDIEVFASFPKMTMMQLKFIDTFRGFLSKPRVLKFMSKMLKGGSTASQREKTKMLVYGELSDEKGNKVIGRMEGPEGGFVWTSRLALEAILQIQNGKFKAGFQTPASAFGSAFVSKIDGVKISKIEYFS